MWHLLLSAARPAFRPNWITFFTVSPPCAHLPMCPVSCRPQSFNLWPILFCPQSNAPVPYSFVDAGWMPAKYPVTSWPWETLGADGHRPFLCGIHRLGQEKVSIVKSQDSECWGPISHVLSVKGVSSSFVEESSHTGQKKTDAECASSSGSLWLKSRQEARVAPLVMVGWPVLEHWLQKLKLLCYLTM